MAVLHRAVRDHEVGSQSLPETFIQAVSEDVCLFLSSRDPRVQQQFQVRKWKALVVLTAMKTSCISCSSRG